MNEIFTGILQAFRLLISFDREIFSIVALSIFVSGVSTVLSAVVGIPAAVFLGTRTFRGEQLLSRLLYTMMSLPSVLAGLLVAIILSRKGPLGSVQLLFTPSAMIISQTILITPLVMGLTYKLVKEQSRRISRTAFTLGATRMQTVNLIAVELKADISINVVAAFSRAISEVGGVMIVGGNIRHHTRLITTSIAMYNSMGEYSQSIALGIILLLISFIVNNIVYSFKGMNG